MCFRNAADGVRHRDSVIVRTERTHFSYKAEPILSNFKQPAPLSYLTDDQGDECVAFIRRHKGHPFLLFASFAAPHSPMQATEQDLERFAHIEDKLRRTYCAMVCRLDLNVGKILAEPAVPRAGRLAHPVFEVL
jgi:Sulfatase